MTLSEIVERVERATGPDREIDVAIECEIGGFSGEFTRPSTVPGKVVTHYANGRTGTWGARDFTHSLERALTLVPKGHATSLHIDADGTVHAGCMPDDGDGCSDASQCGATPALGMLAAVLRARLAMEEGK